MTDIVIRFDTEDYVNEVAAEGILRSAKLLESFGVRGSFVTVGMLAEALEKWGRQDVLDALKYHEIGNHSYAHSMHPTINEYTDTEDFDKAMEKFLANEKKTDEILSRLTGKTNFPIAAPPGDSTSYVAHYGYSDMGYVAYSGDLVMDEKNPRPVHACNLACFKDGVGIYPTFEYFTREEIKEKIDSIASKGGVCIFYHHPQRGFVDEFTDELNFKNGENTPPDKYVPSTHKTKERTEKFYDDFKFLMELLTSNPNINIITHKEAAEKYFGGNRTITVDMLPDLKNQLDEYFFPVTTPDSYCIADILLACKAFLLGEKEYKCGKVYGFLSKPYAIESPVTVTKDEMIKSIPQFGNRFLPEKITVGDNVIGPADWLRAAMEIIVSGKDEVTVKPGDWQIDMDQFPYLRDLKHNRETWPINGENYDDTYISERMRLQSWTFRFPKGTSRKVFE